MNLIYNTQVDFASAISQRNGTSDSWLIVTNVNPKRAIKNYGYRFGTIESIFKFQKSNGFLFRIHL